MSNRSVVLTFVSVLLALDCGHAALGDELFAPAVHYGVGDRPNSVAIGDLDGDQSPDLVVANAGTYPSFDGNVGVLLGISDGTFGAAVHYPAGDHPYCAAIGDLDGDQAPDLAVANRDSNNVSVLLGVGDGTFAAAVHYGAGNAPASVAIGDLDGDQVPDLAVANGNSDNVSVLLGIGDGTFGAAVHYPASLGPSSVAIGDLDGDQSPDLAVANWFGIGDEISVLLGIGDGTFRTAVPYAAGDGPRSVAIGDLDGDQTPDLAVANRDSDNVSVLLHTPAIPGDLNGDRCVDQADLGILLADWGCTGGNCPGDCDADGDTDSDDLGTLLAHWGEGCG